MDVRIEERDEAGNLMATYAGSAEKGGSGGRWDVIYPEKVGNLWTRVLGVFLPAGYPHSVTEDYMKYQIYDSLQAFSSSIAGLLSSRAVLQGVGVGDASASPTTALLLSILQESTGRIATIVFADRLGTSLEPECKMYRLAADVFNDAAMLLDCLSPALPRGPRVLLLSSSSMLRALCGVAAGSSKASLSAHFAKWGNLGELNAKDSSQETVISLLGMLAGSVVVSYVSSPISTWTCLVLLLSIHLAMNRAAVRAVTMQSLNRQRANLVTSTLIDQDRIMSPQEVSMQERIFEWDGVLRWRSSSPFAAARIGLSLRELLASLAPAHERTGSIRDTEARLTRLIRLYGQEEFLVWYDAPQRLGHITLKEGAAAESQLKAWVLVLWTAHRHHAAGADATGAVFETSLEVHRRTLQELSSRWSDYSSRLRSAGWDLVPNKHPGAFYFVVQHSGKVLDVEGGAIKGGTKIIQWHKKPHHDAANQKFVFNEDGYITLGANENYVLDIEGGGGRGTKVILWNKKPSHDAANQRWKWNKHGQIVNRGNENLVLDVEGGSHNEGAKLIVWDKKAPGDAGNQKFHLEAF